MTTAQVCLDGQLGMRFVGFLAGRPRLDVPDDLRLLLVQYGLLPFAATFTGTTYAAQSFTTAPTRRSSIRRRLSGRSSTWTTSTLPGQRQERLVELARQLEEDTLDAIDAHLNDLEHARITFIEPKIEAYERSMVLGAL